VREADLPAEPLLDRGYRGQIEVEPVLPEVAHVRVYEERLRDARAPGELIGEVIAEIHFRGIAVDIGLENFAFVIRTALKTQRRLLALERVPASGAAEYRAQVQRLK